MWWLEGATMYVQSANVPVQGAYLSQTAGHGRERPMHGFLSGPLASCGARLIAAVLFLGPLWQLGAYLGCHLLWWGPSGSRRWACPQRARTTRGDSARWKWQAETGPTWPENIHQF
jgi:hypothetical protein